MGYDTPSYDHVPIQGTEISVASPEIEQLVGATSTLTVEDMPLSSIPTKRLKEEDYPSPQEEGSPKRTRVSEDADSGILTPFF